MFLVDAIKNKSIYYENTEAMLVEWIMELVTVVIRTYRTAHSISVCHSPHIEDDIQLLVVWVTKTELTLSIIRMKI